jgi:hypothetical protein
MGIEVESAGNLEVFVAVFPAWTEKRPRLGSPIFRYLQLPMLGATYEMQQKIHDKIARVTLESWFTLLHSVIHTSKVCVQGELWPRLKPRVPRSIRPELDLFQDLSGFTSAKKKTCNKIFASFQVKFVNAGSCCPFVSWAICPPAVRESTHCIERQ